MESCLQCPITALVCYEDLLLTGQKSMLMLYCSLTRKLVCTEKTFKRNSIHKISEINPGLFLIFGGKSIRIVQVHYKKDNKLSVDFICDENELKVWIWDGIHLHGDKYLLISIHNTTLIWDSLSGETSPIASCSEQCILYSARLKKIENEVLIAAGTVFNQVLLWKTVFDHKKHSFVNVYKRFCGHEGVIFSIRFHPTKNQLLTVSDDRSIRLWSVDKTSCLQIFYGHTARVWDAHFLSDEHRIVSIGEDAACIIWSSDEGTILKKFEGHKGKSIWSMSINDSFIFTGGGDGGIRQWPLETSSKNIQTKDTLLPAELQPVNESNEKDFPRIIKFIDASHLLVFTNNGSLLTHNTEEGSWKVLHHDPSYYTYCVMALKNGLAAFANLHGTVEIMHLDNNENVLTSEIFEKGGKVFSLNLLQVENNNIKKLFMLACGPEGKLKLYEILLNKMDQPTSLQLVDTFSLPHSKQRWITDAVLTFDTGNRWQLVCGDRRGSLHLFDSTSPDPRHSALGVHGKTGVTSVIQHGAYFFTTGRDGNFRKYQIHHNEIVLVDKQKVCKGLDWIEGLWFDNNDIIIYGFYLQSYFAMWNYTKNEIVLKLQCGGGYRSWDVLLSNKIEEDLQFSYLKGPVINMASAKRVSSEESVVFKEGIHGKEVLCAQLLGYRNNKGDKEWLIATGSEDTTVNFLSYNEMKRELKLLHTAVGHIGGVKDLSFIPKTNSSSTEQNDSGILNGYLISCGSRTSLKKWSLNCSDFTSLHSTGSLTEQQNRSCGSDDITCCLQSEIFNPEMNPKQLKLRTGEFIDDMRFMSCDTSFLDNELGDVIICVCACSDGAVRIYMLGEDDIELLCIMGEKKHCFQTVKTLHINSSSNLVAMATSTDGYLSVWNLSEMLTDYKKRIVRDRENSKKEVVSNHVNKHRRKFHELETPLFSVEDYSNGLCLHHRIHQSGINSLDVDVLTVKDDLTTERGPDDSSCLLTVATGGDDNALNISTLQVICRPSSPSHIEFKVIDTKTRPGAHVSSITGVKFIDCNYVISTSVDQMVKIWNISKNEVAAVKEIFTDVADVSNLEIWRSKDSVHMVVTGFGLEIVSLNMKDL